ncbi:class F sortase [Micromonospora sp. NBC_01813]|uniref:class F sortase n=1 Tax=Micromonospora sp. NBC_01813 TaxID=2975988 RepID=UPI002DDA9665|nr:class F sortase [Micromonospora sp. NBC_01813]WSA11926.1 class F sortase [Micromonospora sp. NBC_01813]
MTVVGKGALAATAAGAAVLLTVALAACGAGAPDDVGADEVRELASPSAPAGPAPSAAAAVPVRPGALPEAAAALAPTRLAIPAIDVVARVDPVGIDPDSGEFDVPPSVDRVGWYRFGPGLDTGAGSLVIAGHVDGAGQGPGAFFRLRELSQGDRIEVVAGDQVREFRVVGREEYDKSEIPLDRYFARDGEPRLTLITCGGPFDAAARRYRDNIVVTAVPA